MSVFLSNFNESFDLVSQSFGAFARDEQAHGDELHVVSSL